MNPNDLYLTEIAASLGCHRAFIMETIEVMKETIADAENVKIKRLALVVTAEALAIFHRNKRNAMENAS
jgi:hypothetical protein